MLSADTLFSLTEMEGLLSQAGDSRVILTSPPAPRATENLGGGGSALAVAPFPLEQTFQLHSLPGASKTIYLDFDGHLTRDTQWNTDSDRPNILTPAFDMDDDTTSFSDFELLTIQQIWERVAEDFRPFNVNVTTQDPGIEALRNLGEGTVTLPTVTNATSEDIIDQGVVLSQLSFTGPITAITDIDIRIDISHSFDSDLTALLVSPEGTVIELFADVGGDGNNFFNTTFDDDATLAITDAGALPPFAGSFKPLEPLEGLNGEDPNGIWTLVIQDNRPGDEGTLNSWSLMITGGAAGDIQWGKRVVIGGSTNDWYTPSFGNEVGGVAHLNSFNSTQDDPAFVFNVGEFETAETISHEVGHTLGLHHDGQLRDWQDVTDPEAPVWHTDRIEYYNGHGLGATSWAPIMGTPFTYAGNPTSQYRDLTQWSKGEYANAIDSSGPTLQDDLEIITDTNNGFGYRADDHGSTPATASQLLFDEAESEFSAEGLIERNTDVDYFSFVVEGLGEVVSLDIHPFARGPNLDILAKLYNAAGTVIATSNPLDALNAGSQTFGGDGGWRLTDDTYVGDLLLAPGTYYVSVEGTGRPLTFIDPTMPPQIADPPDPFNPLTDLPPDNSDWGYSKYGSLGYFSIEGTRKRGLVVGVDFDAEGGTPPQNWRMSTGGGNDIFLSNLRSEAGVQTPFDLRITTTGNAIETFASENGVDPDDLPAHALPLGNLDGYIATGGETLTFTWSDLEPGVVYEVYVFGHADQEARNVVEIVGGLWNNQVQTFNFTQQISADGLVVNDEQSPGSDELNTLSFLVVAEDILDEEGDPTGEGRIRINVTNEVGYAAAIAGVAIASTKVGSIQGLKFNDIDGDRVRDGGEESLEGWTIYLDLNDDGQLNLISTPDVPVTVQAPNVPQAITDHNTVKNELMFTNLGQIEDVNVTLDITHPFNGDLDVYLISPSGTRVKLFSDVGSFTDNFTNTTLDDEAATYITAGTAPFTGTFRPENHASASELAQYPGLATVLSAFDGEDANGTWQLEITDDALSSGGQLNSWAITVTLAGGETYLEPFTITDANGNYSFNNLQPGLYNVREHITPEQVAAGWHRTRTPAPVTVRSGANVQGINFGNWIPTVQRGSIQGQKWADDGNGIKDDGEPGLAGWVIYLDSNGNNTLDTTGSPITTSASDLGLPIRDDLPPTTSQLTFEDLGTVVKVEVTLDIAHSFMGDLTAFLLSPTGTRVELFTLVGGQFNDFNNVTLDDNAALSIEDIIDHYNPLTGYTGTWRPEGLLSDFIGENANGIWTLDIQDTAEADQGVLNGWSIKITLGELFTTTNEEGIYVFPNVPAGEYTIREVQQPGWSQVTPAQTSILGAVWADSEWTVTITDDPTAPDGLRNVVNVDFGNQNALTGDYNGDLSVDAADYILWRKTLATTVSPPGSGADGNGSGAVDMNDLGVWRANFGAGNAGGGGGSFVGESSSALPESAASDGIAPLRAEPVASLAATSTEASSTTGEATTGTVVAASFGSAPGRSSAGGASLAGSLLGRSGVLSGNEGTNDTALVAWLVALADGDQLRGEADAVEADYQEWEGDSLESIDSVFEVLGTALG